MTEPAYSLMYDHSKLKVISNNIDTQSLLTSITNSLNNPLNNSQRAVFNHSFKNRVTLLWGPPGTGKTTTLACIVLAWVEYAKQNDIGINIGVGSSNWTAIDNLLKEILQLIENKEKEIINYKKDVIVSRIHSDSGGSLEYAGVNDVIVYSPEATVLKSKIDSNRSITISGSTWKQFYNFSKFNRKDSANEKKWFDVMLLDESSQIKVENASAYFLFLKDEFNLVLAGDDKQLGPIHGFHMDDKSMGLYDCIYAFMKESHNIEVQTIVENYRSNRNINDYPNTRFYLGKLESKNPEKRLDIQLPLGKPDIWPENLTWNDNYLKILDPKYPIVVLTYPSSIYTVSNQFEGEIVASLCYLYKTCLPADLSLADFVNRRIGVVTPHRAQRSLIQNLLLQAGIPCENGSFVDTVDRFQGQERDIILSSYTVSDKDFVAAEDEFILDPRRFNVSLTRARSKFIMIISDALINYLPDDKTIAENAAHLQMFVLKYCNKEESIFLPSGNANVVETVFRHVE